MAKLKVIHLELGEANEYVATFHRHHKPVVGHRFSLGCVALGQGHELLGVCICGRPVARGLNARSVIEVTRLCTNGADNVCSFLYGAAARAAKELGYDIIQTYILDSEPGTTLKATGWKRSHITTGGSWNHGKRKGRRDDQPQNPKICWRKILGTTREEFEWLS